MFSDSVVSVNFLIPVCSQFSPSLHLFIVITSLTLVMLVNGSPVCPPPSSPSLPPLKLPVGYYRDMFINAVCDSLLPLSRCCYLPIFHTYLPFSSKMRSVFFSFFLLSVSQLSPSSVPSMRFFCPFSPFSLSKSHYFVNFVPSRCQRGLICKSHSRELTPNLPQYSIKTASQSRCLQYRRASILWLGL